MSASEGKMVIVKAGLYFVVALLTPLAGLLATAADANTNAWPMPVQTVSALMTGLVTACVALRAYLDGSNERWKENRTGIATQAAVNTAIIETVQQVRATDRSATGPVGGSEA